MLMCPLAGTLLISRFVLLLLVLLLKRINGIAKYRSVEAECKHCTFRPIEIKIKLASRRWTPYSTATYGNYIVMTSEGYKSRLRFGISMVTWHRSLLVKAATRLASCI